MRRIKPSEGGVPDPVTGKLIFPPPPAAGVLDPSLMNQIMGEIATVIEGANMELDETKTNQLQKALRFNDGFFAANTVIPVPVGQLQTIWNDVKDRYVAPNARVTLQLAAGTHTMTDTITSTNPNGDRITIIGSQGSPNAYKILFANQYPTSGYVVAKNGGKLTIKGVTIDDLNIGGGIPGWQFHAIHAHDHGVIIADDIWLSGEYYINGLCADRYGRIICSNITSDYLRTNGTLDSATYTGYTLGEMINHMVARDHGQIIARDFVSSSTQFAHTSARAERGGYIWMYGTFTSVFNTILATEGGTIRCDAIFSQATGQNDTTAPFKALNGGRIYAYQCSAGALTAVKIGRGFDASNGSQIWATNCVVSKCSTGFWASEASAVFCKTCQVSNCDYGYFATYHSYISATGSTASGFAVAAKFPAQGQANAAQSSMMGRDNV